MERDRKEKATKQINLRTCAVLEMALGDGFFEDLLCELPRIGQSRGK